MLNVIKKTFIILVTAIFLLISGLVLYVYFNEQKLISYIISSLNEKIETKVSCKNVDITILKNFPDLSLSLSQLKIESADTYLGKNSKAPYLLTANKLHIHFNLYHFLHKNFIINGISLEDGSISVLRDKKGVVNYRFWKDDRNPGSSSDIGFGLEKIKLENVRVNYVDLQQNMLIAGLVQELIIQGKIDTLGGNVDVFLTASELKSNVKKLPELAKDIEIKTNCIFSRGDFTLKHLKLQYDQLRLSADVNKIRQYIEIKFVTESFPVYMLNQFGKDYLPEELVIKKGNIIGEGSLSTRIDKIKPGYKFKVVVADVAANYYNIQTDNISGAFEISGSDKRLEFSIHHLKVITGKSFLELEADYKKEFLTSKIKAKIDVNDVRSLLNNDLYTFNFGTVETDFSCSGALDLFSAGKLQAESFSFNGKANLRDLNLSGYKGKMKLSDFNSDLIFKDDVLEMERFAGKLNSSGMEGKLSISNLISYLNSKEQLVINGNIDCDTLIPVQWMFFSEKSSPDTVNPGKNKSITGNVKLNCENLIFDNIHARKVHTDVELNEKALDFRHVSAGFSKGSIESSTIRLSFDPEIKVQSRINFRNIDIHELFRTFKNFNQTQLVAENIHGNISGSCESGLQWNNKYELDLSKIKGSANFEISNGTLVNFKPIKKLANFLEVNDINHIKFNTIKNTISISDRILYIPEMAIHSSAINIKISGQHSFSNEYEYHFNMLLTDILLPKRKNKKVNEEFGKVEEEQLNQTRIYVKLTGKNDKYKIAYDNRKAMDAFSGKMANEKTKLKSILKEEFLSGDSSGYNTVTKKAAIESNELTGTPVTSPVRTKASKKTTNVEWKDE